MSRYRIVESVGNRTQDVHSYEDLEIHHPSANRNGLRTGRLEDFERDRNGNLRPHARVDGDWEEVRTTNDGRTLVKKDLVLSQDTPGPVHVPSPVSGYLRYNQAYGTAEFYDGPGRDAKLLGKVLHMRPETFAHLDGKFVQYGQPLGVQWEAGRDGRAHAKDGIGVHAHIELEPEQFRRYIRDIDRGVITPDTYPGKGQSQGTPTQAGAGRNDGEAPAQRPTPQAPRDAMADGVLKQGENGPAVRELQETLNRLGLRDAQGKPLEVDGRFGQHTREAVEAFQRNHGLDPDGKAGPLTLGLLKTGQPAQDAALDTRGLKPEREGPPPFLPERAQGPLISDAAHPDNALFRQAYEGLGKLGPGGYLSERERENAAASLAYEARLSGVQEINHVVANKNGNGYFGVQGELGDPASHRVYVDKAQAGAQPVEQTTQNLRQDLAALPQPAVQQEQQNKQAHAHAH